MRRNQISSFSATDRVHLNRPGGGRQFSRLLRSRIVRISGDNAGYTMFRSSVKGTGYTLHSPISPSVPPLVRHRVPSHFNWSLLCYFYKKLPLLSTVHCSPDQEMPSSNTVRTHNILVLAYYLFPQKNVRIKPLNRPRPLPSSYLLFITKQHHRTLHVWFWW